MAKKTIKKDKEIEDIGAGKVEPEEILAAEIKDLEARGLEVFIFDGTKGLPIKPTLDEHNIRKPRIAIHHGDSFTKIRTLVDQARKKVEEYEEQRKSFLAPSEKTKKLIALLKNPVLLEE